MSSVPFNNFLTDLSDPFLVRISKNIVQHQNTINPALLWTIKNGTQAPGIALYTNAQQTTEEELGLVSGTCFSVSSPLYIPDSPDAAPHNTSVTAAAVYAHEHLRVGHHILFASRVSPLTEIFAHGVQAFRRLLNDLPETKRNDQESRRQLLLTAADIVCRDSGNQIQQWFRDQHDVFANIALTAYDNGIMKQSGLRRLTVLAHLGSTARKFKNVVGTDIVACRYNGRKGTLEIIDPSQNDLMRVYSPDRRKIIQVHKPREDRNQELFAANTGCSDSRLYTLEDIGVSPPEMAVNRTVIGFVPPPNGAHHTHVFIEHAFERGAQRFFHLGHSGCGGVKALAESCASDDFSKMNPNIRHWLTPAIDVVNDVLLFSKSRGLETNSSKGIAPLVYQLAEMAVAQWSGLNIASLLQEMGNQEQAKVAVAWMNVSTREAFLLNPLDSFDTLYRRIRNDMDFPVLGQRSPKITIPQNIAKPANHLPEWVREVTKSSCTCG